ncbi:Rpn family recombination-promoting nuclease/putative transposase [Moorena sp. SIO4G3]|uniref:Rpn family recombination-promoting nuclease/putative transposase n=1 Tax=Moorena sp. SIO4G3 TaxID=2607821 RepID=UPI00142C3C31|nr:Rpn family recombination-promoting nuclease/putative transposase [Moorena sp. SIO4G3]NEO80139.1 Rpn family recombination-promoting nuclease/putative transposase [Moorena sp. SIO4G3]
MAYDNICKYLAENYPADLVRWLHGIEVTEISVLKTELNTEPIHADSLTLLQTANQILHWEFQTLPVSKPSLPLRMLKYWVRLKEKYDCPIEQVVIFLKFTRSEKVYTNQLVDTNTSHRYRVIRMWEQDPEPFLANPALLPFAPLALSESPTRLLEQVAAAVDRIEEPLAFTNISACTQLLAGLRFDQRLITELFPEDVMQESVIYQKIIQKGHKLGLLEGKREGLLEGRQEEGYSIVIRQLTRRFGSVSDQLQQGIQKLSVPQLEELSEALLDFETVTDLTVWLAEHQQ